MLIASICENGDVLSVLRIVKIVITIIRIAVPIILIISLMINYMNAVKDNDELSKYNKAAVSKIIAAVLIFLIPTFINLITDIADPSNKTYISCLDSATSENISAAYRVVCEKNIDKARESLKLSDYQIALSSLKKVTEESDRNELQAELDELYEYVEIREKIIQLSSDFNSEEYKQIQDKIDKITDEEMKEKLTKELKETLGSKGSMSNYNVDPNAEVYRNNDMLSGNTLSSVLLKNGSSVEKFNLQIEQAVNSAGVGTRKAPVAAALTLIETLAGYGYKINYYWGGKYYKLGVNPNWGAKTEPYCEGHPNPPHCYSNYQWVGFDCSGFVNWALMQGMRNSNYKIPQNNIERINPNYIQYTAVYDTDISLSGKSEPVCDVGDVLINGGHIVLVVGFDNANKNYVIAESSGSVKLSTKSYGDSSYYCRRLSY